MADTVSMAREEVLRKARMAEDVDVRQEARGGSGPDAE